MNRKSGMIIAVCSLLCIIAVVAMAPGHMLTEIVRTHNYDPFWLIAYAVLIALLAVLVNQLIKFRQKAGKMATAGEKTNRAFIVVEIILALNAIDFMYGVTRSTKYPPGSLDALTQAIMAYGIFAVVAVIVVVHQVVMANIRKKNKAGVLQAETGEYTQFHTDKAGLNKEKL